MAITQDRMTRLLAAAEDLRQALDKARGFAREAAERARGPGGDAQAELQTLESLLAPEFLLQQPLLSLMAIEREREHWTEARLERNEAKRAKRQREHGQEGERE